MKIRNWDFDETLQQLGLVATPLKDWIAIQELEPDFHIQRDPFWSKTLLYRPEDGQCLTRVFSQVRYIEFIAENLYRCSSFSASRLQ